MHVLSMAENILQLVIDEAVKHNGKHIAAIDVGIADNTFIEADWLQFCLEVAARGTIAEGAQIEIALVDSNAYGYVMPRIVTDRGIVRIELELA